ncbi:MAG: ASKHA domain-containing protein [Pseudomonadota bacterium]
MEIKDPWIKTVQLKLNPPTLKDNTADADRLVKSLKRVLKTDKVKVGFSILKGIPSLLRRRDFEILPVFYSYDDSWHVVDLFPMETGGLICGLAIDLGSSTIVMRLLDMATGEIKDESSFTNPQNHIGSDILTRVHFASQKGGLERLQSMLIERLNQEIHHLTKKQDIHHRSIVGMSVAGNTIMTHLFLGLDPYWIYREPYIPVVNSPDLLKGDDMDLMINPEAPVLVIPNVGSYFGGDLVAGILASGMHRQKDVSIMVDVGTNAEVVLGNREWLIGCAGAAGPALEGGVAGMGMMAGPGAIDKVVIDPSTGQIQVRAIGDRPPVGICGSGLIDLVSQLFSTGMIDLKGKFVTRRCGHLLRNVDGVNHIVVLSPQDSANGRELTLSQAEIDALLRSKAAMYTIITTLSNMVNVSLRDIKNFYIAGTFGSYIDPRSAITLGMIPDLPLENYTPLGNTSLNGASRVLISAQAKDEIYQIRDRITYVELNVNQEFMNLFNAAKFIPHTDRSLFPSVSSY